MFNGDRKTAQAATELAIFGAILIFILGTIIRTALSNSYTQNQDFKAMRMAMLASWNGSVAANTSHNNASVIFIEDRLSPDFGKYGALDRVPYISMGSGSFTYYMLYPVDEGDVPTNLPIMDMYVNGLHFPLTEASFATTRLTPQPAGFCATNYTPGSCGYNQCLRRAREWVGGSVSISDFTSSTMAPINNIGTTDSQRQCQALYNGCTIFRDLSRAQMFSQTITGKCDTCGVGLSKPSASLAVSSPIQNSCAWTGIASVCRTAEISSSGFTNLYQQDFPTLSPSEVNNYLYGSKGILRTLKLNDSQYKLFYSQVANSGTLAQTTSFSPKPRTSTCGSPPCPGEMLTSNIVTNDYMGNPGTWNGGANAGDMMYDLLRTGNYGNNPASLPGVVPAVPAGVENQFGVPLTTTCDQAQPGAGVSVASMMRCYIGWQWSASAGLTPTSIGLDTSQQAYPEMDIDGRLKPVTVYGIAATTSPPAVTVSYEDFQHGDIDGTWDSNSCGPKPGLSQNSQVMTFTSPGCMYGIQCPSSGQCPEGTLCGSTYLLVNDGKLYNPETGQLVRSASKKDNVDLIQRSIVLSTNTGRFCTDPILTQQATQLCAVNCAHPGPGQPKCSGCANPNPVEVCVNEASTTDNCFYGNNIKETCYDTNSAVNTIFVRSRLQDLRGRFWLTDTTGQLQVH